MASRSAGGERSTVDGPMVLIDRPESSGYRVDIYSPSDQPVTASAGVFSFEGNLDARARRFSRRALLRLSVLAGLGAVAAACAGPAPAKPGWTFVPTPSSTATPATAFTVEIHRSPTCACCHEWVAYLRAEGTAVTEVEEADVSAYKRSLGIPQELWSCHTSVVDSYVVEGHVPLEAIERLLSERPDIDGIALAGMPPGSPGMPGPKEAPLEVQSFRDGVVTLFGSY